MKQHQMNKFWVMLTILVVAALACQGGGTPPVVTQQPPVQPTPDTAQDSLPLTSAERVNLMSATVQIYALFEENGELQPAWTRQLHKENLPIRMLWRLRLSSLKINHRFSPILRK
jgi:hypothetical protein